MEIIYKLLVFVALISFIVLILVIINAIKKFLISLKNFEANFNKLTRDFNEIKIKSIETIDGINELKAKSLKTLSKYDIVAERIIATSDTVERDSRKIINTFEPYAQLIDEVYSKIAQPVTQTTKLILAVSKSVNAFFGRLLNK